MENKTKVIEIRGLTKRLKNKTVLNDVTLDIFAGDICGISGHNGSGKSMLLKAISGFLQPTSGSIKVFGEDVGVHGKLAKDTGVLIEAPGLLLGYSAFDNLYMLARLDGFKDKTAIEEILTTLELDPKDKRPVSKYSLGMKQKVGIA